MRDDTSQYQLKVSECIKEAEPYVLTYKNYVFEHTGITMLIFSCEEMLRIFTEKWRSEVCILQYSGNIPLAAAELGPVYTKNPPSRKEVLEPVFNGENRMIIYRYSEMPVRAVDRKWEGHMIFRSQFKHWLGVYNASSGYSESDRVS